MEEKQMNQKELKELDELHKKAVGVYINFRYSLILGGVARKDAEVYALLAKNKFIEGGEWQREQMMKKAFGSAIKEYSNGSTLSLDDYELYQKYMNKHFKAGDRVKLIIIKQEKMSNIKRCGTCVDCGCVEMDSHRDYFCRRILKNERNNPDGDTKKANINFYDIACGYYHNYNID